MRPLIRIVSISAIVVMLVSISLMASGVLEDTPPAGTGIGAVVTIAPQREMVETIGEGRVHVTLMVPAGQDPHSYEPSFGRILAASTADIYFMVGSGVDFEISHMSTLREVNPSMLVVDCSKGILLLEQDAHHHHSDGGHDHEGNDPHIWLSPMNLKQMARNVCDGLVELDPESSEIYERNLKIYEDRMDRLHDEISSLLADHDGMSFMVFHPAWGYFAHDYGLEQVAIEQEKQEAGAITLSRVIRQAMDEGIRVIFTSPHLDDRSARVIAYEIRGMVANADPLPSDVDAELLKLAQEMVRSFEWQGGRT